MKPHEEQEEKMEASSLDLSLCVRNQQSGFPTRSDTNWSVESQKLARSLKNRRGTVLSV